MSQVFCRREPSKPLVWKADKLDVVARATAPEPCSHDPLRMTVLGLACGKSAGGMGDLTDHPCERNSGLPDGAGAMPELAPATRLLWITGCR